MQRAKAHPGELAYASAGMGGTGHLSAEMFKAAAKIDIRHIPYKGSGPAQADFLGNQVPLMVDSLTAGLPERKAARAIALAVTTAKRLPQPPRRAHHRGIRLSGLSKLSAGPPCWRPRIRPRPSSTFLSQRIGQYVTER